MSRWYAVHVAGLEVLAGVAGRGRGWAAVAGAGTGCRGCRGGGRAAAGWRQGGGRVAAHFAMPCGERSSHHVMHHAMHHVMYHVMHHVMHHVVHHVMHHIMHYVGGALRDAAVRRALTAQREGGQCGQVREVWGAEETERCAWAGAGSGGD